MTPTWAGDGGASLTTLPGGCVETIKQSFQSPACARYHQHPRRRAAGVERLGEPKSPHDVAAHRCIGFSPLFWGCEWRFIGSEGPVAAPIRPVVLSNSSNALREAALNGLGLTTLPIWVVDGELASGRLVQVLKEWATPESGIYAVYPSNRMIPPKVRRFVEAIAARLREGQSLRQTNSELSV